MKALLTGLFLAISAFPASFAVGVIVMQHTYGGGLPTALDAAAKTIAAMLAVALFVFCGGLVSKMDPATPANSSQGWSKNDQ